MSTQEELDEDDIERQARKLLESPNLLSEVIRDTQALGIAGEEDNIATIYLVGTSRLLQKPLAAIVRGSSSSGKSELIGRVSELFPTESKLLATDITPKGLLHITKTLEHKFLVAGERSRRLDDEAAERTRILRQLLSEGQISQICTTVDNGKLEAKPILKKGPVAFIESTTLSENQIFAEDLNRCLILQPDASPQQTERIMMKIAATKDGSRTVDSSDIIKIHHAAQRLLGQKTGHEVIVPFATDLTTILNKEKVATRRGFRRLLSMIEAVALLYSFQREHDKQGRIVAEEEDRDVALRLLEPSMRTLASGYVTDGARELLQKLQGAHPESDFNSAAAYKLQDDVTDRTVRSRLQELARSGHIEVVSNQKNKRTYRLATPSGTSARNPAASFTNAFQRQDTPSLAFPASDTL